jgi:GTPase
MSKNATERPAAVLVAVQLSTVADEDHAADMAELGRLVNTLGYDVVATVSQRRSSVSKGAVLGEGKLRALAEITGGPGPAGMRFKKPGQKRDDDEEHEEAPESVDGSDDADDADAGAAAATRTPTLVIVDHDLTPSQLRNLEKCTGIEVLDRSGVIIEIFHRHARSREARLEVEIARLNYVAPRMRESSGAT